MNLLEALDSSTLLPTCAPSRLRSNRELLPSICTFLALISSIIGEPRASTTSVLSVVALMVTPSSWVRFRKAELSEPKPTTRRTRSMAHALPFAICYLLYVIFFVMSCIQLRWDLSTLEESKNGLIYMPCRSVWALFMSCTRCTASKN